MGETTARRDSGTAERILGLGWCGALFLLAVAAYARTLGFAYRSDDFPMIRSTVHDDGTVRWQRLAGFFTEPLKEAMQGRFYRPVWRSSYAIDGVLGAQAPISYGIELGLFGLLVVLVARLGRELGASPRAAIVAGGFLALSPVPVEAVAWIAARTDLLAVLGVALGLVCGLAGARRGSAVLGVAGVGLGAFLALGAKESGVVLAPMLALALAARYGWRTALRGTAWLFVLTAAFWAWRARIVGDWLGGYADREGYATLGQLARLKLRTFAAFAFPLGDPWWRRLPDVAVALSAAGIVGSVAFAARRGESLKPFAVALGLVVLGFVPIYSIDVGGAGFPGTRQFLLPSLGWALAIGLGLDVALRNRRAFLAVAIGLLVAAGVLQQARLGPYAEASRASTALREQLAARQAEDPDGKVLFHELPERYGPALCALNALPSALLPPFADGRPNPRAQYLTDGIARGLSLDPGSFQLLLDPELRSFAWDRVRVGLVEREFRFGLLVVKGEFEVEAGDDALLDGSARDGALLDGSALDGSALDGAALDGAGATVRLGDVRIEGVRGLPSKLPDPGTFSEIRLSRARGAETGWRLEDLRPSQPVFVEPPPGRRFALRTDLPLEHPGLLVGRNADLRPLAATGALLIEKPRAIRLVEEEGVLQVAPEHRELLRLARYAQLYQVSSAGVVLSERFELR